jgi:TrmH family RNA methyltransferase
MSILITSPGNERIKQITKLAKPAERARRRLTLVEGERECGRALAAGLTPHEAYLCPALLAPTGQAVAEQLRRLDAARRTLLVEVTPEVFAKLAYRGDSGGLLLVLPYLDRTLADLDLPDPLFVVVIEGVEKPGNLGAVLRTADAAGVQAVIVTAGATDIHNPNVIRASLGALFSVPVVEATTAETVHWLRSRQARIVATRPDAAQRYTDVDYTGPVAIVMGAEATGLSATWSAAADEIVTIPMFGQVDSLNLATATALLLYEVVRQRRP